MLFRKIIVDFIKYPSSYTFRITWSSITTIIVNIAKFTTSSVKELKYFFYNPWKASQRFVRKNSFRRTFRFWRGGLHISGLFQSYHFPKSQNGWDVFLTHLSGRVLSKWYAVKDGQSIGQLEDLVTVSRYLCN